MSASGGQRGFSLIELVISLAIAGVIVPLIGGIVFLLMFFPSRSQADIEAQQDAQLLSQWITIDANRARDFSTTSLAPLEYGVFAWTEFGGAAPVSVEVTYFYDQAATSLVRKLERNGAFEGRNTVASNIASFEDANFAFSAPAWELIPATGLFEFRPGQVSVIATSTVEKIGQDSLQVGISVIAEFRTQFDRAVPTPGATPVTPGVIANDGWESGDFSGGSGWLNPWTVQGGANVAVTKGDGPHDGIHHLRLRSSDGRVSRDVDLSGRSGVHLTFFAKVSSFESGDTADVEVSPDGTSWTTVKTFTSADSDDTYHFFDIDLSSFSMTSQFFIAFDANMNAVGDRLFIDNVDVMQ